VLASLVAAALLVGAVHWHGTAPGKHDPAISVTLVNTNGARIDDFFRGSPINPSLVGGRPGLGPQRCSKGRLSAWGRIKHFLGLATTAHAQGQCLGCYETLFYYPCPSGDPRCSGGNFAVPDGGGWQTTGTRNFGPGCGAADCGVTQYVTCDNSFECDGTGGDD
jgi:hypothetical protein